MKQMEYLKLIRMKHWVKNALIAIPAFFGGALTEPKTIGRLAVGFFVFSFYSSAVYVINDLCDREADRLHPEKCKRPLAKGSVSFAEACVLVGVLMAAAMALSVAAGGLNLTVLIPMAYFLLNLLYSAGLKNKPVLDLVILVSGFVIRVFYGSVITGVVMSGWLYLTVLSLSLFLAFGKRRNEKKACGDETRKVLRHYSDGYLNSNMYMYLTLFAVFYAVWSLNAAEGSVLILTTPLVLVMMMRYTYVLEKDDHGDPVEMLYRDPVIWCLGAVYLFFMAVSVYFPEILHECLRF